jgi:hypothetical protein
VTQQNFQLTFSGAPLGADQLATIDAYRAHSALGEGEAASVAAAVDAYLAHHPGMARGDAAAAVARVLFEARQALSARAKLDRMAFADAPRRAARPAARRVAER